MKITINPDAIEHTYRQLARQLRAAIRSGEIGPRLPSIMELTEETGLAPGTVRRAIRLLADEGLVVDLKPVTHIADAHGWPPPG